MKRPNKIKITKGLKREIIHFISFTNNSTTGRSHKNGVVLLDGGGEVVDLGTLRVILSWNPLVLGGELLPLLLVVPIPVVSFAIS